MIAAETKAKEAEQQQREKVIIAQTRAKEAEQEQERRLTVAETSLKEAEVERQRKAIELETSRLEAERIVELAQADARGRQLKMEADGALEQRLAAYTEVATAFAGALKDKQLVPQVVVGGAGESGTNQSALDLVSLIMSKVALDLGAKVSERAEVPMRLPAPPAPATSTQ